MGDTKENKPDFVSLFGTASEQHGLFTAAQARDCGFSRFLLARHAETGKFIRVRRGLYRLRDYPSSPHEEVMAAWLAVGKNDAVVSHETALDLLDLSDVTPHAIHLTVPRSKRNLPDLPGVALHTTTRTLDAGDTVVREGVRLTSPIRTILDTAETGTAPEQIERAVRQAIAWGLFDGEQLRRDAASRSGRVRRLIEGAIHGVPA